MSSSTGEGYLDLGAYNTKPDDAEALTAVLPLAARDSIMEGHAGGGGFVEALLRRREAGKIARVVANDINPTAPGLMTAAAAGCATFAEDFLRLELPSVRGIVGNPPYGIPQPPVTCPKCLGVGRRPKVGGHPERVCRRCEGEGTITQKPIPVCETHVRRALDHVAPYGGFCAFLVRAGFVIEARQELLTAYKPLIIWGIEPRPSFYGSGNDSASYVWSYWDTRYPDARTEYRSLKIR